MTEDHSCKGNSGYKSPRLESVWKAVSKENEEMSLGGEGEMGGLCKWGGGPGDL